MLCQFRKKYLTASSRTLKVVKAKTDLSRIDDKIENFLYEKDFLTKIQEKYENFPMLKDFEYEGKLETYKNYNKKMIITYIALNYEKL